MKVLHMLDACAWWRVERRGFRAADGVVLLTDEDRASVARSTRSTSLAIIPLAVHVPENAADPVGSFPPSVLFVGGEQHPPNVEAAERLVAQILPLIADETARLVIVGQHSSPVLRRCTDARLQLAGHVADVAPYLEQAAIVVAPVRLGGGMRVKVLEALAVGKAVVATSKDLAGTDAFAAGAAILAETDQETAAAIARLLHDPHERSLLGARARQWALNEAPWTKRAEQYCRFYDTLLVGRGGR